MEHILKNIGGQPDDKYYRYKRSVVNITYKNSCGGQTVIDNLDKIFSEMKFSITNNVNLDINSYVYLYIKLHYNIIILLYCYYLIFFFK